MNKPVMHSFRRTTAILKLHEKDKGPSRSLNGVRTEIPALTFYAVSQITVENSINPRHMEQKGKACQNKLSSFFTVEKRQKSDENPVEEVQSPKTIPNLQLSINCKHWKSEEDFDYEKAAAIKGAQKKTEE